MTDLWVRQISSDLEQPHYRWYMRASGEHGVCALSELAARWPEASLTLLISGTDCPSRRLAFKPEEKRHLARLMPYELEADLAQDIAGLHVALGLPAQGKKTPNQKKTSQKAAGPKEAGQKEPDASQLPAASEPEVVLSYMDKRALADRIAALENAGFDVRHCYAEPLLLPGSVTSWVLRLVDGQVDINWGPGSAASVDLSMLGVFLDSLLQAPAAARATAPQALQLQGLTTDEVDILQARVSASVFAQSWQPEVSTVQLENLWQSLDGVDTGENGDIGIVPATIPDLRQGIFARPVRWQKYWRPVRLPLMAAALAALTFAAVTLIETQLNNQRFRNLQQETESAYREVVPDGVLVDAEQQLRAQLGQLRGNPTGRSVLAMLDRITPQLSQNAQVSISRLSYNGADTATAQSELQLSIEAASNTDILQFSEQLNNSGLQARAQNMTQSGARQQASMIITEAIP